MQILLKIVMIAGMLCVVISIIFLFILVKMKKRKRSAGICLMVSALIFVIAYAMNRNCSFADATDTSGKEYEAMIEDDITPKPDEVADNPSVTPFNYDNNSTNASNENVKTASEGAAKTSITPIPKVTEEQIMQLAMKEQWYMYKRLFIREDKLHTFHMGWYDDSALWCVFDEKFYAASVENVEDSSYENALVYKGLENGGSIRIIYYYDEERVEIIDLLGLENDYSGIYYLDEASVIEPDLNSVSTPTPKQNHGDIDYLWYKSHKKYSREDGNYTITMHWDNNNINFIFSDGFAATGSIHNCDEFIDNDMLFYEDISDIGTIDITYYFLEDKLYVIDSTDNGSDHSGYYYPSN